jgi:hypothetical protein
MGRHLCSPPQPLTVSDPTFQTATASILKPDTSSSWEQMLNDQAAVFLLNAELGNLRQLEAMLSDQSLQNIKLFSVCDEVLHCLIFYFLEMCSGSVVGRVFITLL